VITAAVRNLEKDHSHEEEEEKDEEEIEPSIIDRLVILSGSITGGIANSLVHMIMEILADKNRHKNPEPIRLRICSPGGEVAAGQSIMDAVYEARAQGLEVHGLISGAGESMAAQLLQACTVRSITEGSYLMLHGMSLYADNENAASLESYGKLLTHLRNYWCKLLATRTSAPADYWDGILKSPTKVYYTPEEALAIGLVDVILPRNETFVKETNNGNL